MKPAAFRYHAPKTIEEAVAMLAQYAPDDGRVLAGGQSLVPTIALRLARPHHLVDINGIADLRRLASENGRLAIGAGVRHQAFHRPVVAGPLGDLLSAVRATSPIIRSAPAARSAAASPMPTLRPNGAWSRRRSTPRWWRARPRLPRHRCAELFPGHHDDGARTRGVARRGAAAAAARQQTRWGFYEFNRRAGDFAMAMALVTFEIDNGVIAAPRIGVGGAEAPPRRIAAAEALLAAGRPVRPRSRLRPMPPPPPSIP